MKRLISAFFLIILIGTGCSGVDSLKSKEVPVTAEQHVFQWQPEVEYPKNIETIQNSTISFTSSLAGGIFGFVLIIIQPSEDGDPDVHIEFRMGMGTENDRYGVYITKTKLPERIQQKMYEDILSACVNHKTLYPITSPVALYLDLPDGRRLAISNADFDLRSPENTGNRPRAELDYSLTCFKVLYDLKRIFLSHVNNEFIDSQRVLPGLPLKMNVIQWDDRKEKTAPADFDYKIKEDLLKPGIDLRQLPGALLGIAIGAGKQAFDLQQLTEIWQHSSDQYKLAIAAHLMKYSTSEIQEMVTDLCINRLSSATVTGLDQAKHGMKIFNNMSWEILFALECNAAKGCKWPLKASRKVIDLAIGGKLDYRILAQWQAPILLNYYRENPAEVTALIKRLLDSEYWRLALNAVVELDMKGCVETIRCKQSKYERILLDRDLALAGLGDRKGLASAIKRIKEEEHYSDLYSTDLMRNLRFIPTFEQLKNGLPGLPVNNKKALADYIAMEGGKGNFVRATEMGRLASDSFAHYLLGELEKGELNRYYLINQLAWQTENKAVEKMIALLKSGDKTALQAVALRWNPRLFPKVQLYKHGSYRLNQEQLAGVDWNEVRKAAREDNLHCYSLKNTIGSYNDFNHWTFRDMKHPFMEWAKKPVQEEH